MEQEIELTRWITLCETNKHLKSCLKKISKEAISISGFFDDLKVIDNSFYGEFNVGYNAINGITLKKVIDLFLEESESKDEFFLLATDGTKECNNIIKHLLTLNDKKCKFVAFENFCGFDKKFVSKTIKNLKPKGGVYLSKSIFNNKIISLCIFDSLGNKVKNDKLVQLTKKMNKDIQGWQATESFISSVSFLNTNSIIKLFIENINSLFIKTPVSKKTKICISNRSTGITKILTKIIGIQDFSYIVNNNVKNKPFFVYYKWKKINSFLIKLFFLSEIIYARSQRANLLITYSPDGSQLFLFDMSQRKTTYFNSSLVTMIFLNNFFNDLAHENKKLPDSFIATNSTLSNNIEKLTKKFQIKSKKIINNNFVDDDYMLLFWNDYNQFVFGEKKNDEFTIYHILIKLISIIDYYNGQYRSINGFINSLNKIYGTLEYENRYYIKIKKEDVLDNIKTSLQNKSISKYFLTSIKITETIKTEEHNVENEICCLDMYDGSKVVFKYNEIAQAVQITLKRYSYKNVFRQVWDTWFKKRLIKKLIK